MIEESFNTGGNGGADITDTQVPTTQKDVKEDLVLKFLKEGQYIESMENDDIRLTRKLESKKCQELGDLNVPGSVTLEFPLITTYDGRKVPTFSQTGYFSTGTVEFYLRYYNPAICDERLKEQTSRRNSRINHEMTRQREYFKDTRRFDSVLDKREYDAKIGVETISIKIEKNSTRRLYFFTLQNSADGKKSISLVVKDYDSHLEKYDEKANYEVLPEDILSVERFEQISKKCKEKMFRDIYSKSE